MKALHLVKVALLTLVLLNFLHTQGALVSYEVTIVSEFIKQDATQTALKSIYRIFLIGAFPVFVSMLLVTSVFAAFGSVRRRQ